MLVIGVMFCIFGFYLVLNYNFQCKLPQILKLIFPGERERQRESVCAAHASREERREKEREKEFEADSKFSPEPDVMSLDPTTHQIMTSSETESQMLM